MTSPCAPPHPRWCWRGRGQAGRRCRVLRGDVSKRLRGVVGAARAERARSPSPCSPRSQSATPRMKIDQPARARSSHDLRKRTRSRQRAESITKICGSFAMDRGKSSALTIQHCRRSSNGRCGVGNTHLSFHLEIATARARSTRP